MGEEGKSVVEIRLDHLEDCVFGKPGSLSLEDKVRKYVDDRDDHKERNMKQMIVDLQNEQSRRDKVRDDQHVENTTNFGRVFKWMDQFDGAMAFGKVAASVIAFLCMAILALLGYLAANRNHSSTAIGKNQTTVSQTYNADAPVR